MRVVEVVGVGHRAVGEGGVRGGELPTVDQQGGFRLPSPIAHLLDHFGDAPGVVAGNGHADRVEDHLLGRYVGLRRYVVRGRVQGKLSQDPREAHAACFFAGTRRTLFRFGRAGKHCCRQGHRRHPGARGGSEHLPSRYSSHRLLLLIGGAVQSSSTPVLAKAPATPPDEVLMVLETALDRARPTGVPCPAIAFPPAEGSWRRGWCERYSERVRSGESPPGAAP